MPRPPAVVGACKPFADLVNSSTIHSTQGTGTQGKTADMIQESSFHLRVRKSMLPVLENGISRLYVRDGMLAHFQMEMMVTQRNRQIATTMTTCFLKIDPDMLQKTQENPLQLLQ